jgi:hypothetical protein
MFGFKLRKKEELKRKRDNIYIFRGSPDDEYLISGLQFYEFAQWVKPPLENIMLLDGRFLMEEMNIYALSIIEGANNITDYSFKDLYSLGNFHFVDYKKQGATNLLSPQEIASLLYLSHTEELLSSPYISCLENRFAYLAHDDGFFCKLFCRDSLVICDVIAEKIVSNLSENLGCADIVISNLPYELNTLLSKGIFIDLTDISIELSSTEIKCYCIGKFLDPDDIFNNMSYILNNNPHYKIVFFDGKWALQIDDTV